MVYLGSISLMTSGKWIHLEAHPALLHLVVHLYLYVASVYMITAL